MYSISLEAMFEKVTIVVLFYILSSEYFVSSQICTKRSKYYKTVRVSSTIMISETYYARCWYGDCKRSRKVPHVTYRISNRLHTNILSFCCNGYTEDSTVISSDRISCNPVCVPDCTNGYCSSPGKCSCNNGYELDTDINHNCKPVCDKNCEHGRCEAPNVCACDFGFKLQNVSCSPICTEPCINGICIAPENCQCDSGYRHNLDDNKCAPYCSLGCLNGNCAEPEICSCNEGYVYKNGTCIPDCSNLCGHGKCIAPNVCECYDGYEHQNGDCFPICTGCVNGTCVSSENCECNRGYKNNLDNNCVPHCSNGCSNGNCTEPEVCTCNEGFLYQNGTCIPDCSSPCGHGKCVAPNVCECFDGYKNISPNNTCQPHCSKACDHGTCIEPEVCQCDEGYALQSNACMPVCKKNCVYSSCIKPDTCECWAGYKKIDKYRCTPNCTQDCENGVCAIHVDCVCSNGYKRVNNQCIPICFNCGNGTCIHPGVCKCHPGYELKSALLLTYYYEMCAPVCNNCNGTCIEPGVCTCDYPYVAVQINVTGEKCDCHGNCTAYNVDCYQTICVEEKVPSTEYISDTSFTSTSEENSSNKEFQEFVETSTDIKYSDETSTELENFNDGMVKNESAMPYWIYIIVSGILILIFVFAILLSVKRKYIAKYFQSGSYPIQENSKSEMSRNRNVEMKLSSLLNKNKEELY